MTKKETETIAEVWSFLFILTHDKDLKWQIREKAKELEAKLRDLIEK